MFQPHPWAAHSSTWPLFWRINFPNVQLNPLWYNLQPFPLVLLLVTQEKRLTPSLPQPPFLYCLESYKVCLELPFLQSKHSQFSQLFPIRAVLQTLLQLCCPSLGLLHGLNVFLVVKGWVLVLLREPGTRASRNISVPSLAVLLALQNYSISSSSSSVSYYMEAYRRVKAQVLKQKRN